MRVSGMRVVFMVLISLTGSQSKGWRFWETPVPEEQCSAKPKLEKQFTLEEVINRQEKHFIQLKQISERLRQFFQHNTGIVIGAITQQLASPREEFERFKLSIQSTGEKVLRTVNSGHLKVEEQLKKVCQDLEDIKHVFPPTDVMNEKIEHFDKQSEKLRQLISLKSDEITKLVNEMRSFLGQQWNTEFSGLKEFISLLERNHSNEVIYYAKELFSQQNVAVAEMFNTIQTNIRDSIGSALEKSMAHVTHASERMGQDWNRNINTLETNIHQYIQDLQKRLNDNNALIQTNFEMISTSKADYSEKWAKSESRQQDQAIQLEYLTKEMEALVKLFNKTSEEQNSGIRMVYSRTVDLASKGVLESGVLPYLATFILGFAVGTFILLFAQRLQHNDSQTPTGRQEHVPVRRFNHSSPDNNRNTIIHRSQTKRNTPVVQSGARMDYQQAQRGQYPSVSDSSNRLEESCDEEFGSGVDREATRVGVVGFSQITIAQHERNVRSLCPKQVSIFRRVIHDWRNDDLPWCPVYILFVDFNERNVILEEPGLIQGETKTKTAERLINNSAEAVFVVYCGDVGSKDLPTGALYNPELSSVTTHPILRQLCKKGRVLSIKKTFNAAQRQKISDVINTSYSQAQ